MPKLTFRHPSRRAVVLALAVALYAGTIAGTYY
jgi:hypothetical protein